MNGEQRVILAFEMSMFTRELARAGIQHEHPDWPEERVNFCDSHFCQNLCPRDCDEYLRGPAKSYRRARSK